MFKLNLELLGILCKPKKATYKMSENSAI